MSSSRKRSYLSYHDEYSDNFLVFVCASSFPHTEIVKGVPRATTVEAPGIGISGREAHSGIGGNYSRGGLCWEGSPGQASQKGKQQARESSEVEWLAGKYIAAYTVKGIGLKATATTDRTAARLHDTEGCPLTEPLAINFSGLDESSS